MICSGGASIKIGGQRGQENFLEGKKVLKMHANAKALKNLPFYVEIVKFGLILTHLKLYWGENGGGKKIFWGINAPCPCGATTVHTYHTINDSPSLIGSYRGEKKTFVNEIK